MPGSVVAALPTDVLLTLGGVVTPCVEALALVAASVVVASVAASGAVVVPVLMLALAVLTGVPDVPLTVDPRLVSAP